jgi:hypothetical protein
MAQVKGIALILILFACQPGPPKHYSIDDDFSVYQTAVIETAFEEWCDTVGYCPEKVSYSERGRVVKVMNYTAKDRINGSHGHNGGSNIYIDGKSEAMEKPAVLWLIVAHEIGHYCIDGHPVDEPSLMAARVHEPNTQLIVDKASANAWDCD